MQKIDVEESELEELRKQKLILKEQERIEHMARASRPTVVAVG